MDRSQQKAIVKAKREWECTADALAELVCLLDSDGRIIRANRVVETWMLGDVTESTGKPVHDLMHPECSAANCDFRRRLREALSELRSGTPQEFDFHELPLERRLHFVFRPLTADGEDSRAPRDSFAVLVVSDYTTLYEAELAREKLNASLESRVRARTRELAETNRDLRNEMVRRERAEGALRASSTELAHLSKQLIKAQESERKRIASELHDSVGQSLSAVKYTVERALEMIRQPRLGSPDPVLASAVKLIQETAESIRAISMNLRPQILDNFGVASAVRWFCSDFADIYPNIAVHVEISIVDAEIPERLTTTVFRCIQELLNNVAKHSRANAVWVSIERSGQLIGVEVRDDGIGMESVDARPGSARGTGLTSLRERAQMTGGELFHGAAPGSGTSARMTWQLTSEEARVCDERVA